MLNKKGMTLVEMVIAMLVLASAGVILMVGFSTVAKNFVISNQYKDLANNSQKMSLTGESISKDYSISSNTLATVSFTLSDGSSATVEGIENGVSNNSLEGVTVFHFAPNDVNQIIESSGPNIKPGNVKLSAGETVYVNYCNMMAELKQYCTDKGVINSLFSSTQQSTCYDWIVSKLNSLGKALPNNSEFTGKRVDITKSSNVEAMYKYIYGDFPEIETNYNSQNSDYKYVGFALIEKDKGLLGLIGNDVSFKNMINDYENKVVIIGSTTSNNINGSMNIKLMYDEDFDVWYKRISNNIDYNDVKRGSWINLTVLSWQNYTYTEWKNELRSNSAIWSKIN